MKKMDLDNKTILVTGSLGFIGSSLINKLCTTNKNIKVLGLDILDTNNPRKLKLDRLSKLNTFSSYKFINGTVSNKNLIFKIFSENKIDIVVNLAAKVGNKYAKTNPDIYIDTNINGFYNILEACKNYNVNNLIYASSASIYGNSLNTPFKEEDEIVEINDLYGATKKNNEIMAYTYSNLFNINTIGLRMFTVYGPGSNPNMAYNEFVNKLINKEDIEIYNDGDIKRDFIYIDDVVDIIIKMMKNIPDSNYNIYNICNNKEVSLLDFIKLLKDNLIKEKLIKEDYDLNSIIKIKNKSINDIPITLGDNTKLIKDYKYSQKVSLEKGVEEYIKWYKEYYQ